MPLFIGGNKMKKMNMVIYESNGEIIATSKANYYSYIQNPRRILRFPSDIWTIESVIDYLCKTTCLTESCFESQKY